LILWHSFGTSIVAARGPSSTAVNSIQAS
jgi:hypothetical protein